MSRRIFCNRFPKPLNSFMMAIPAVRVDATESTMHRGRSPNRYNNSQVVKENLTWLPAMTGCLSARCVGFMGRGLPSSTAAGRPPDLAALQPTFQHSLFGATSINGVVKEMRTVRTIRPQCARGARNRLGNTPRQPAQGEQARSIQSLPATFRGPARLPFFSMRDVGADGFTKRQASRKRAARSVRVILDKRTSTVAYGA
jgi:hypothetical protein